MRLLELLQADASMSNQDLAAAVNVSAPTGLRRVRRLLEAGVIERRVALLAPSVVGGFVRFLRCGAMMALPFTCRF